MAHRHVFDGVRFTGMDVPDGPNNHYHMLPGNQKTSSNPDGPRHTHTTPDGRKTSGPVPLGGPHDDMDEPHDDEVMGKSKKKKSRKQKWKY